MKRHGITLLLCCFGFVTRAQHKLGRNLSNTKDPILEVSYTIGNNMSAEVLEKNTTYYVEVSEEDKREAISSVLNAHREYTLFVNTITFESLFEMEINPTESEDEAENNMVAINVPLFHKDKNTSIGTLEIGNTQRFFLKDIPPLKWKITKETKNIGDWTCTKAVPEGDFMPFTAEVWFTEDVPFPNGPLHYFGLPGLVVEVVIPEIARITFSGMKHSDKGKEYIKSKAETYRRELEKKKEKTTSWEEAKAQFGLIAKQMGH